MMKKKLTTDVVLNNAVERMTADVVDMNVKKNRSIDVFNATAKNLESINADLKKTVERCRHLAEVANSKADEAEKTMADNANICSKIYEIIGKPAQVQVAA